MTDHNLTNHAAEQAAKTEALIHQAAEYLFAKVDWKETMPSVLEHLNTVQSEALEAALVEFVKGNNLTLRLLLDKAAMDGAEVIAAQIVAIHGDKWLLALENYL